MKQSFKTLKWFSLEWGNDWEIIILFTEQEGRYKYSGLTFTTEQQAFDWLEANGYIERIKE